MRQPRCAQCVTNRLRGVRKPTRCNWPQLQQLQHTPQRPPKLGKPLQPVTVGAVAASPRKPRAASFDQPQDHRPCSAAVCARLPGRRGAVASECARCVSLRQGRGLQSVPGALSDAGAIAAGRGRIWQNGCDPLCSARAAYCALALHRKGPQVSFFPAGLWRSKASNRPPG